MSQQNYYGSGGAGGFFPGSPSSPGGQKKEGLPHSVRPMVAKQIINATQAHSEAEWFWEGQEIGHVVVVGAVVEINKQATNTVYKLDDGTGRIEARHWAVSSPDVEDEPANRVGDIVEGQSYARVTGVLKTFGQKRYINALNVRPVKNPLEPHFHILDVMYADVAAQRGPPNFRNPQQPVRNQTGPSAYSAQSSGPVVRNQYGNLQPLHRKIMEGIAAAGETEEGVHISIFARNIGAKAEAISEALEELMADGAIYETGDDSHFKLT